MSHYHKQKYSKNESQNSSFKQITTPIPFAQSIRITDISLHQKGPQEDEFFLNNPEIIDRVRRGNSEINKQVVRRGLQKFFDLKPNFFLEKPLSSSDQQLYDHIISPIQYPVRIIKMFKANGENCQISYYQPLDAWVIASKNVALLARTVEDLKDYQNNQRFQFAILIAETWFSILNGKDIQKIKDVLISHTFIGEYCGNQQFQHLIKYWKIDLIFYAVVPKTGNINCLLVESSVKILKDLGFEVVDYQDFGVFQSKESMLKVLNQISNQVTESEIEKDQEGCVLYFENDKNQMLCKVKTLEYRIYRKLREKLKKTQFVDNDKLLKSFKSETMNLVDCFNTPKQLQYYFKIASMAFSLAQQFEDSYLQNQLQGSYLNFLSIVIYCEASGIVPDRKMVNNFQLIDDICKKTWSSFYKFSDKQEPIKNISNKVQKIYVIAPMTIPGSGKTHFKRYLQSFCEQNNVQFFSLSSDEIRLKCMQQIKQKFPNISDDELFQKTNKPSMSLFYSELDKIMQKCENSKLPPLVFLDKNHPPSALNQLTQNLETFKNVEIIYLHQPYPLSLEYVLFCIYRVQKRDYHETLHRGPKSFEVIMMFLGFFQGYKNSDLPYNWCGTITGEGLQQGLKLVGQKDWKGLVQWWEEKGQYLEYKEVQESNLLECCQKIFKRMGLTTNQSEQVLENQQKVQNIPVQQFIQQKQQIQIPGEEFKNQQINVKKKYTKAPLYIGLELKSDVKSIALQLIQSQHINVGKLDFQPSFHITTLYVGNNINLIENNIYKQFQEDKEELILLQSFFIIKDMIAFFSVKPLQSLCENKFPHITMMVYAWKPRMSNVVLESLQHIFDKQYLNQRGIIQDIYQNSVQDVNIQGEHFKVNIFKCDQQVKTQSKKFY